MIEGKIKRTAIAKKAKQIAKLIKEERPDYHYMRTLFQLVRKELDVVVLRKGKKLALSQIFLKVRTSLWSRQTYPMRA